MRWIILPAVLIVSFVAATSDAAGLFADDEGMIIPDHRLPVYMAYRGGAAPCDYPGTAYAGCGNHGVYGNGSCNGHGYGNNGARYQPFAPGYHGYMGNGCYGRCSNVWSGYDHCAQQVGSGCKGRKGWGCGVGAGCNSRDCAVSGCSRCPNKVYGLDYNCGHGCGMTRTFAKGCGSQHACRSKCGHAGGFQHAFESICGHGCGCKQARVTECGCDAGCDTGCGCGSGGCRKACKHKKFGFSCGLKGFCSGLGECFGANGGCDSRCEGGCDGGQQYGSYHGEGEVISETTEGIQHDVQEVMPREQEVVPPAEQILPLPEESEIPQPPSEARSGVKRTWQQASAALFPSLRSQQNR